MTSQPRTLPPDIVSAILSEAALTDAAKVQTLATAIAFEDDGPLAQRLMSVPMPETDPCSCPISRPASPNGERCSRAPRSGVRRSGCWRRLDRLDSFDVRSAVSTSLIGTALGEGHQRPAALDHL